MLIAIDGACKRNGEPDCFSTGVAWFITDTGDMFFKAACETQSTSQRGELSGAELAALMHLAKQHKEYVPNCPLVSICNTLFYCGAACIVGFCKGDDTMPVPKCLKCGKACPDLKGHIVIRSHQREWICQECWEAAFGKEEGEKHADSH